MSQFKCSNYASNLFAIVNIPYVTSINMLATANATALIK